MQIENLTIISLADQRKLVENFSLTVDRFDRIALIGEEGNGKSTLLKWIHNPALIEGYASWHGTIHQKPQTGYLPQRLPYEDETKTIYEFFSDDERFFAALPAVISGTLASLQLDPLLVYEDRLMGTLSGGEKIKVQLARLLVCGCRLLLLDEPTNDLDLDTLRFLETALLKLPVPLIFVSHDEGLLAAVADRIVHIELLRRKKESKITVANTDYETYMEARSDAIAKQAQKARSDQRRQEIRMEKYRKISQTVEHDLRTVSRQDPHTGRLLKKKMHAVKAMEKRFERESENLTKMPETEEAIAFFFQPSALPVSKVILSLESEPLPYTDAKITLTVTAREKVTITGPNGSGKTTLLRKIEHILKERPDLNVGMMPQNYEELLDLDLTPVAYLAPDGDRESVEKAREYLGSMRYTSDEMLQPVSALSGGQKAKLLLLKLNLQNCNVLLLDEPTRNLSVLSAPVIRSMLAGYTGCIIAVSHDRLYIEQVSTAVYRLEKNRFFRL
ncbi:MAG: ABC-F family ATP-binding cassette domain-containing protein [Solobacterium sp.]|nr:ABC-F family ATP-binding cassette domain-containing protein [Solobacterium sp.]